MNDIYKFRNTINPVISGDHYVNSQSIEIKHNGNFVLLDSLVNGFSTLTVSGREILPQTVNTSDYDAGQDGASVTTASHQNRQITVTYLLDTQNKNVNDMFRKLNFYLSQGKIQFRFLDDNEWFYIGYVTGVGDLQGTDRFRTGDFTITCYDPVRHYIDTHKKYSRQILDNRTKEGYVANVGFVSTHAASVLASKQFNGKSYVSAIALNNLPLNEDITVTLYRDLTYTEDIKGNLRWNTSASGHSAKLYFHMPAQGEIYQVSGGDIIYPAKSLTGSIVIYLPTYYHNFAMYNTLWDNAENLAIKETDSELDVAAATSALITGKSKFNITGKVTLDSDIDDFYFFGQNNVVEVDSKSLNNKAVRILVVYDEASL